MQPQTITLHIHRYRLLNKALATQLGHPRCPQSVIQPSRQLVNHLLVMGKTKSGIELAQGNAPEHFFEMIEFRFFGAQETAPSRSVEEQIAHGDGGATGMPRRGDRRRHIAPLHGHLPAFRLPLHITGQAQPGNGTDRRQSLTAKSQRANGFQIIQPPDFAGGVARQSQRQIIALDATAVVAYPQQFHPALLHIHTDGFRASVQRILQQLFEHRRGALNHFTGGNLVSKTGIKQLNFGQNTPFRKLSDPGTAPGTLGI